jgi:hypothetical protein
LILFWQEVSCGAHPPFLVGENATLLAAVDDLAANLVARGLGDDAALL